MRFGLPLILCASAVWAQDPPLVPEVSPTAALELTARERQAGMLGVGFIGLSSFSPSASALTGGGLGALGALNTPLSVPLLGIRYWLKKSILGLDLGAGAMAVTYPSSTSSAGFQLHVHAGLPIAIASSSNVIVIVAPEFRAGFKSSTVLSSTLAGPVRETGSLFELGIRGAVELYFAFLGAPQLSLEVGIRVAIAREAAQEEGPSSVSSPASREVYRLSTSLSNDTLSLLASSFALKYYF